MTFLEELRKENIQAMKDKDTLKKGVYSLLISAINLAEKEKGEPLTKEEALKFVQREVKQAKETLDLTPKDRTELIEESKKKIELLESYLPKQLSVEELEKEIQVFLAEHSLEPIKKNQGEITKGLMAKLQGATDGKSINMALSKILK
ncbi:GatB/YqeY domain-containing protein [Anaerorhabdus sp.]|uniref:GatB/YqeY domain-containing protein n=1 Tax=Anaerorhabdus sp. TaxID=1872524 RepID=UPI002FC8A94D